MPPGDHKPTKPLLEDWKRGLARLTRVQQKVPLYASLQDFIPFIRTIEFRAPDYVGDPRLPKRARLRLELIPIETVIRPEHRTRVKRHEKKRDKLLKQLLQKQRNGQLIFAKDLPIPWDGPVVSLGVEDLERLRAAASISDRELAGMLAPYWSAVAMAKRKYVAQIWKLLFGRASTRQRRLRRWLQSLKPRIGEKRLEDLLWICYWVHEIVTHHRAARLAWTDVYGRRILPDLYRLNLAMNKARAEPATNGAHHRLQRIEGLERRRAFLQALKKSHAMFKAGLEKHLLYDAALIIIERRLVPMSKDDPDRVFEEVATLLRVWNPPAPPVSPRSLKQLACLSKTPRTRHLVV